MGVMSCSRYGCESIMCDTYVETVGYVCNDCQSEFEDYSKKNMESNSSEGEILRHLKIFMDTDKDSYTEGEEMSITDFFKSYRN